MVAEINNELKDLYDFLDLIRFKSSLYIGDRKITTLQNNINGYNLGCIVHKIKEDLKPDWKNFHDFVADKLNYYESTTGWKNMILEKSNGNEEAAFLRFYELFDLFRQVKR